jgi:hypothetical protein
VYEDEDGKGEGEGGWDKGISTLCIIVFFMK